MGNRIVNTISRQILFRRETPYVVFNNCWIYAYSDWVPTHFLLKSFLIEPRTRFLAQLEMSAVYVSIVFKHILKNWRGT